MGGRRGATLERLIAQQQGGLIQASLRDAALSSPLSVDSSRLKSTATIDCRSAAHSDFSSQSDAVMVAAGFNPRMTSNRVAIALRFPESEAGRAKPDNAVDGFATHLPAHTSPDQNSSARLELDQQPDACW